MTNKPDTQHSDWRTDFRGKDFFVIMNGNAPITDMIDFIASEKSKSYGEGIRKAVEVVDIMKLDCNCGGKNQFEGDTRHYHYCITNLRAELNQLLTNT